MDAQVAQIFQLIALYFVYYIGVPALILFIIWRIKQKRDFIQGFSIFSDEKKDKSSAVLEKNNKQLKNLKILLVIFILISIPALNLTFHGLQDISMRRSRNYMSWETEFPAHFDYVVQKIGPNFDGETVIEQMEEDSRDWYLDDIGDQVDLGDIVSSPGRITVYRLRSTQAHPERIVITYSYLSPLPITRSIEFIVLEDKAFLEADNFIVYPMPPSTAAPI